MDNNDYKRLQIKLLFFDETDVIRTSGFNENDWEDDNADDNGWT